MDIVFDIGNVILEWNPQRLVAGLFSSKKEGKEVIENIIAHEDWQMLDKGTLSLEEAISRANDRCNIGINKIRKLFEETPKSLTPIQETRKTWGRSYNLTFKNFWTPGRNLAFCPGHHLLRRASLGKKGA